jgi:mannan endo-1,6-alpha-mannosidase
MTDDLEQTDGSEKWKTRVSGLLDTTLSTFFPEDIAYEISCEKHVTCTTDMLSFKGYVHRWLATTTQIAPFTKEKILTTLQTSTAAAIAQCTGGTTGRGCGFKWSTKVFDGREGAGQTMNVLAAVSSLLIESAHAPVTNKTGGTSVGDLNAGSGGDSFNHPSSPITTGDKAGAGILTLIVLGAAVGTFGWMSTGV